VDDYNEYLNKVDEYSKKQIEWVLKNKKQIKRFFDYTSFDKKNQNKAFFTTFTNSLFYPYYKIGNKNQEWFKEYFEFISSFPSIYTFDKRKLNGLIETMRFTDSDETKLLLESGKNQNPSWSFGGNKWSLWASNVLFDGKSYDNLYIIYPTKDVIYDTGFEERKSGKYDDDDTKECEVFIRKNATPLLGGRVFTYTFQDFQNQFPFIPNGFRLDKNLDVRNGFGTFDVMIKSFPKTEVEKYGYITENNGGTISYLPKDVKSYLECDNKWNKCYVEFFTKMKEELDSLIENTPQSSWRNTLQLFSNRYVDKIKMWQNEVDKINTLIEMNSSNKYQLKYGVSKSNIPQYKGITYPYYEYENGWTYEGTASIFS
jgi:hypothetical protein